MDRFYIHANNFMTTFRKIFPWEVFLISLLVVACSDESDDLPKVGEILAFDLEDLNDLSTTFGQMIGPHTFTPKVTIYYFTNKET